MARQAYRQAWLLGPRVLRALIESLAKRAGVLARAVTRITRPRRACQRSIAPAPCKPCYDTLVQVNGLLLRHWSVVKSQRGNLWDIVAPLYCAVQDSCSALALLSRSGHVRDSYGVARCILETALNASYILAAGDDVAGRAYRHYMQKSLREAERDTSFLREYIDSSLEAPDWRSNRVFAETLAEFSDPSGREKTWAGVSYDARLTKIGQSYGSRQERMLRLAMQAIYRPASEILHGTFYGAMRAAGQANAPQRFKSHQHFIDWLGEQLSLVDVMSSAAAAVLLVCTGQESQRPRAGEDAIETVLAGTKSLSSQMEYER